MSRFKLFSIGDGLYRLQGGIGNLYRLEMWDDHEDRWMATSIEWKSQNPVVDLFNHGFKYRGSLHNGAVWYEVREAKARTSDNSHGGNSVTQDKVTGDKKKKKRGSKKRRDDASKDPLSKIKVSPGAHKRQGSKTAKKGRRQKGGGGMNGGPSYQPQEKVAVARIANLLGQWVGKGAKYVPDETIDLVDFVLRDRTGRNVLPALHVQSDEQKAKLLVTEDVSGSCASHSGYTSAIAEELAKHKTLDVYRAANFNGIFDDLLENTDKSTEEQMISLMQKFDYVVYFGDEDGLDLLESTTKAQKMAKFILLSATKHNLRDPWVVKRDGQFIHIKGVNLKDLNSIEKALRLV